MNLSAEGILHDSWLRWQGSVKWPRQGGEGACLPALLSAVSRSVSRKDFSAVSHGKEKNVALELELKLSPGPTFVGPG